MHFTVNDFLKSRVEWWRCRELNPGPTRRERVHTVMDALVRPNHERASKKRFGRFSTNTDASSCQVMIRPAK